MPEPSPLQRIRTPAAEAMGVQLYLKRDELLHPHVSGNKWRKLLPQVRWLLRGGAQSFASVGGQHSNHLVALAALCQELGVPCRGYVRGGLGEELSASLAFAKTCGMQLVPATRSEVRAWRARAPAPSELDGYTWLPEGGTSRLGLVGMAECVREVRQQLGGEPDAYVVAVGSGGTAAGLARKAQVPVYGMQVVHDTGLRMRVANLLESNRGGYDRIAWHDASLGGFASGEPLLYQTLLDWHASHGIALDPIYTVKAAIRLEELLWRGEFEAGARVVLVHTGGLQGVAAWLGRYGYGWGGLQTSPDRDVKTEMN